MLDSLKDSDQSERLSRHKYSTTDSINVKSNQEARSDERSHGTNEPRGQGEALQTPYEPHTGAGGYPLDMDQIPLDRLWACAPERWKQLLGTDVAISWPILCELASHLHPECGVNPRAWRQAVRVIGKHAASLALLILDCNRNHPTRPVGRIGGALVNMVRYAEAGGLHLEPSAYGVIKRVEAGQQRMID